MRASWSLKSGRARRPPTARLEACLSRSPALFGCRQFGVVPQSRAQQLLSQILVAVLQMTDSQMELSNRSGLAGNGRNQVLQSRAVVSLPVVNPAQRILYFSIVG